MSSTKAVPKPALMGGVTSKNLIAMGSVKGKAGSLSGGTMVECAACGKATKPVPHPKAM